MSTAIQTVPIEVVELYNKICEAIADPEITIRLDKTVRLFKTMIYKPSDNSIMVGWNRFDEDWEEKKFTEEELMVCALFYSKLI